MSRDVFRTGKALAGGGALTREVKLKVPVRLPGQG